MRPVSTTHTHDSTIARGPAAQKRMAAASADGGIVVCWVWVEVAADAKPRFRKRIVEWLGRLS